ncbi:MAG: DUF6717 family protein [Flavisolibacter sp.]|jgi:hypothetical protein
MITAVHLSVDTMGHEALTYQFKKEENRWYVCLPEIFRKGFTLFNELSEGAQTMLNTIARGRNQLSLKMDTVPFDGADCLELLEHCTAPKGGAYYLMHTSNGKRVNKKMWVCDLSLAVFGDLPDGIYFQENID